jgi:hypothetical protein
VTDEHEIVFDTDQSLDRRVGVYRPSRIRLIGWQIQRDAPVPGMGKLVDQATPAPSAMPRPVNQDESRHDFTG